MFLSGIIRFLKAATLTFSHTVSDFYRNSRSCIKLNGGVFDDCGEVRRSWTHLFRSVTGKELDAVFAIYLSTQFFHMKIM